MSGTSRVATNVAADISNAKHVKLSRFLRAPRRSGSAADVSSSTKGRKKKSGKSPKARSMELMRSEGYMVADVERRLPIPGMFVTQDLFQMGDLLCVIPANRTRLGHGLNVLVQVTSRGNMNAREHKIQANPNLAIWLGVEYNQIELHGWAKRKIRGQKRVYWECARKEIKG